MTITNTTITQIYGKPTADPSGVEIWPAAATIELRALTDVPTFAQRRTLGGVIEDATAVIYLLDDVLANATAPVTGSKVVAKLDGEAAAVNWRVMHVIHLVKAGGLSHRQIFVQPV